MFTISKYTYWYYSIINNAKSQERFKGNGIYFERHHIIPKSLGGNNKKENLVLLTAKEHFLCHLLLIKMTSGTAKTSMWYAFAKMNTGNTGKSSACYAFFREKHRSAITGENNPMFGKKHSPESIFKMSIVKQGKYSGYNQGMRGKSHSAATKEKIRNANRKPNPMSEEGKRRKLDALSKKYTIQFPDGHIENIKNLREFCRQHNIHDSAMHQSGYSKGYRIVMN